MSSSLAMLGFLLSFHVVQLVIIIISFFALLMLLEKAGLADVTDIAQLLKERPFEQLKFLN
jgi:hypothetical protein